MKYYKLTPDEIAAAFHSDLDHGLDDAGVSQKTKECGKNEMRSSKKEAWIKRFLRQFKNFMIITLCIAAVVSAVVALLHREYTDLIDAGVILFIVVLNGLIGVAQEDKADKALAALKKMSAPKAKVIRNGVKTVVEAVDLLPGDVMLLEAGDYIAADGVIVQSNAFKTDESVLTGESLPADKQPGVIEGDNHPIADLYNTVFSGTLAVNGNAVVIVTGTGMDTQLGIVADMLDASEKTKTPLQIQLAQMGKTLGLAALLICAVVFLLGVIQGKGLLDMFLTAVSLAVAAIPEGLVATVTVVLAFGVRRLAAHNAVVHRLDAVETLGSASVICTDKTGTLTQNKMTILSCFTEEGMFDFTPENFGKTSDLIIYGSLCNDAYLQQSDGKTICVGDPTEGAFVEALETTGRSKTDLDATYPRMGDIPFDSERKRKTTLHVMDGQNVVVVKGAPDTLYERCINTEFVGRAEAAEAEMAAGALRVLAVAVRTVDVIPAEIFAEDMEKDLVLIGLVGMIDPPRPEAIRAIKTCISAGIRPVMITGDQAATAQAIAERFGIFRPGDMALSGAEIDEMPQEEFERNIEKYSVYARVNPEHKVRIVETWQNKDRVVAMTGDGVNDAPALRRADIGCAMGQAGTDVAVNAADLVLMDDDFATIVTAVRQGRNIFDNIRRTVCFLLSGNVGELFVIFVAMIFAFNIPLLPLHLLWINVVTDLLPALALGVEPARDDLMTRAPRKKRETLIDVRTGTRVIWQGMLIGLTALFAYCVGTGMAPRTQDAVLLSQGQTMAFVVLAFSQILHAFDCRSNRFIASIGALTNKPLLAAAGVSALLVVAVMLPGISIVFGIAALSTGQWLAVLGLSVLPLAVCEFVKIFTKK